MLVLNFRKLGVLIMERNTHNIPSASTLYQDLMDVRQNLPSTGGLIQRLERTSREFDSRRDKALFSRYIKALIDRYAEEQDRDRLLVAFGVHPDYLALSRKPLMRLQFAIDHGLVELTGNAEDYDTKVISSRGHMLREEEQPLVNRLSLAIAQQLKDSGGEPLGILEEILQDMTPVVQNTDDSTCKEESEGNTEKRRWFNFLGRCDFYTGHGRRWQTRLHIDPNDIESFRRLFPEIYTFLEKQRKLENKPDKSFSIDQRYSEVFHSYVGKTTKSEIELFNRIKELITTNPAYGFMVGSCMAEFWINQFYPRIVYLLNGREIPDKETMRRQREVYLEEQWGHWNEIREFVQKCQDMIDSPDIEGRRGLEKWTVLAMDGSEVLSYDYKKYASMIVGELETMSMRHIRYYKPHISWSIINPDNIKEARVELSEEPVEGEWLVFLHIFHPIRIGFNTRDLRVAILPYAERIQAAGWPFTSEELPPSYRYDPEKSKARIDDYRGEFEYWKLETLEHIKKSPE